MLDLQKELDQSIHSCNPLQLKNYNNAIRSGFNRRKVESCVLPCLWMFCFATNEADVGLLVDASPANEAEGLPSLVVDAGPAIEGIGMVSRLSCERRAGTTGALGRWLARAGTAAAIGCWPAAHVDIALKVCSE